MKAFLENFAAIVGAFTVTIFAMSWAHEFGYFWSVGRKFQTFLTTTDYLTNDALWLPFAAWSVYANVEWWRLRAAGPTPIDWKKKSSWAWLGAGVFLFLGWSTFVKWPLPYFSLFTTMTIVGWAWSYLWKGYANKVTAEEPFKTPLIHAIRLVPVLLLGMFFYGSTDANTDLTRIDDPYLFTFKGQTTPRLEIFLRNFDKGALIRDVVSNKIEFHRWEEISEIGAAAATESRTPWCWLTGLLCNGPQVVLP